MKRTSRTLSMLICLALIGGTACKKDSGSAPLSTDSETLLNNLQNNYAFSLFYYALHRTGLDKQLNGTSSYTLLVPDNDAFARDSITSTDSLANMDTTALRNWMSYHLIPGVIRVADVPQSVNNPYNSISGMPVYFSRPIPGVGQTQTNFDQILHINGDTVNTADIIAADGVIQVLNRPLKLPVASVQAYLSGHAQYSELVTALQHFGLWDQLTGPGPITVFAPDNTSFDAIGVTADSLSRLDTVHFQSSLFGIYVVNPARIFLTDFIDIGLNSAENGNEFITSTANYYYSNGALIDEGEDPVTHQQIPAAYWIDPDNIAVNGVVQGMHGVLLTPGQAKKNQ